MIYRTEFPRFYFLIISVLFYDSSSGVGDVHTVTLRRGFQYFVMVHKLLEESVIPVETVFSCTMEIPGTTFSLNKQTMFYPGTARDRQRLSQVNSADTRQKNALAITIIGVSVVIYTRDTRPW